MDEYPDTKRVVHARFKHLEDLGSTHISEVKKVCYSPPGKLPICLARKRIKPRRNITLETLRIEAKAMERLDHQHIIKLVGTYSIRYHELFLLVWPVAVCDLASFLDDIDGLRTGHGDREDIHRRFQDLDLQTDDGPKGPPGTCTHTEFLRQIMGCIAAATAHCHESNIRHLDIKPANILLGPGRVYLADFGIAKEVRADECTHTVGGRGTIKWQASEVANSCDLKDAWSMKAADVYALGLVLVNIAAVLYGGDLAVLDQILTDTDPETRAEGLDMYQARLADLALASQGVRPPDEETVVPRHILKLTSRMTSPDPKKRPSAVSVDRDLIELGGLGQIYHSACCRKGTEYFTGLIDDRQKAMRHKYQMLQEDNQRKAKTIKILEDKDETYETRLREKENHHAKAVRNLERLLALEREERKRLEDELAKHQRRGGHTRTGGAKGDAPGKPVTQLRYSARPQSQAIPTVARAPNSPGSQPPTAPRSMLPSPPTRPGPSTVTKPSQDPHTRPGISFAGAAAAGVLARETPGSSPKPGLMSRRSMSNSKLPLAVTPTRSRTQTPNFNHDLSLTDSTQNSMTSSTLSRFSIGTQETSAAPSPAVGGNSPFLEKNLTAAAKNSRIMVSGVGLGLDLSSVAGHHMGDTDDVKHAIASGALSPVVGSSTMSSPRFTKSELDSEHSPSRPSFRVPGLPTAPSYAEMARRREQKSRA